MKLRFLSYALVALAVTGIAVAAEVKSGLSVGTPVAAFDVKDCSGPNEGKTLCYRCQYGNRPVVAVFTRRMGDDVTSLVSKIDEKVQKNEAKKMAAFVVYLTDEPDAAESKLKATAKKSSIKSTPLTVFQNDEGPESYKISKDAQVTVMMWNNGKVEANHAFGKKELSKDDIEAVMADTFKILN